MDDMRTFMDGQSGYEEFHTIQIKLSYNLNSSSANHSNDSIK